MIANIDCVSAVALADHMMAAVKQAAGLSHVVNGGTLVNGDQRTSVTVTPPEGDHADTLVSVYYGGDEDEQHAIAQRIYGHLCERTDWDIELDSDNADDVPASRGVFPMSSDARNVPARICRCGSAAR